MVLKDQNGRDVLPYAYISKTHAPLGGGIFICMTESAGRLAFTSHELNQHNDPALVRAHAENLEEAFFAWCDAQKRARCLDTRKAFRLERGDLVPIDVPINHEYPECVVTKPDKRRLEDYTDAGLEEASRVHHRGARP